MDVIMPQLGETVAEGTVSVWHKTIGDTVSTKEPLFDVSSDKVEMEVPPPQRVRCLKSASMQVPRYRSAR
jgi:2-oxoglutarate dehydrogenase E2 component (dihydrolipoamide succinyltransferase)